MNTKAIALIGGGVTTIAGGGASLYYFSQDKTIKDRLKTLNINLIETEDEYQIGFKENRNDENFTNLISVADSEKITKATQLDKGGEALKTWCLTQYKASLSKENIENLLPKVTKYCVKPPVTIAEKLNKVLAKNWDNQLAAVKKKTDNDLLKELKKINDSIQTINDSDQKPIAKALQKWCEDNIQTKLVNDKQDAILNKVLARCFGDAAE